MSCHLMKRSRLKEEASLPAFLFLGSNNWSTVVESCHEALSHHFPSTTTSSYLMALWLEHYRAIFVAKRTVSSPAGYTVLYSSVSTNKTHANHRTPCSSLVRTQPGSGSLPLNPFTLRTSPPPYPACSPELKMLCPIIPSLIHTLTLTLTSRPTVPT